MLKKWKQKFLVYINRDDFNHNLGHIDPLDYHSTFFSLATLFNVMDYDETSPWMYISPVMMVIGGLVGGTMFGIAIVHYLEVFHINLLTEFVTYLTMMIYQLLVIFSITNGKQYYHNLLQAFREDFDYVYTSRGQMYRERLFENQLVTFQGCFIVALMACCTGGGMILCFCITLVISLHGLEEGGERPLMFQFWLFDYDLQASPVYEFLNGVSVIMVLLYTYQYSFLMQSHLIWIRQITCKADIITWNLQDLLVDVLPATNTQEKEHSAALIKHRMRGIIEMHHSMIKLMEDFAAVFKMGLFYEQMVSSPSICMTAYCFAEKFDEGEIEVFLLVLCVGCIVVTFVPNFLCTHLLEKVQSVSDACWELPFWTAGPVLRPYLVLMMQRSLRPLPIVAPGFANISLQTYSTILTRAYSCFNMLRQAF